MKGFGLIGRSGKPCTLFYLASSVAGNRDPPLVCASEAPWLTFWEVRVFGVIVQHQVVLVFNSIVVLIVNNIIVLRIIFTNIKNLGLTRGRLALSHVFSTPASKMSIWFTYTFKHEVGKNCLSLWRKPFDCNSNINKKHYDSHTHRDP